MDTKLDTRQDIYLESLNSERDEDGRDDNKEDDPTGCLEAAKQKKRKNKKKNKKKKKEMNDLAEALKNKDKILLQTTPLKYKLGESL
jgi:CRISPR/Cas system CSM-associated protein Csm5 (group 7 of RAMP superfamily)